MRQIQDTIRIVARTCGIKIESSEAWYNPATNAARAEYELKGLYCTINLNDNGEYTQITAEGQNKPQPSQQTIQAVQLTPEQLNHKIICLNAASRILASSPDSLLPDPEVLITYADKIYQESHKRGYLQ